MCVCVCVSAPYLEPEVPLLPGQMQVSYEEGRDHVSHVVVDPAGQPQLPHGGVHQGVACPAPLPRLQVAPVTAPPESLWGEAKEHALVVNLRTTRQYEIAL